MKAAVKRYRSNNGNQEKLKILGDQICDKIEDLFDYFDIDYKDNGKMYTMCCPIHHGDNPSAINIYPEGDTYRGNWKCRTHNCEDTFKDSIIGFVRGLLSTKKHGWHKRGDEVCTFQETVRFCEQFTETKLEDIKVNTAQRNKKRFTAAIGAIAPNQPAEKPTITRDFIRSTIDIPCQYYIDRGYTKEVLDKYDVGLCSKPDKPMSNRIVVPIYDSSYRYMVGCTGRSIFDRCDQCKGYHDGECPDSENLWKYSKWKHNSGFKTQDCLYNHWFAKDYISKQGYAILVESPGNVWKLEENGIHNSLAIFGTNLSPKQKLILDASGAMTLFLIMDNDEAGQKAAQNIYDKCNKTYNVCSINVSRNDIAEMTSEEIDKEIKQVIEAQL